MTKGKRIESPIREGVISKIYSIAYGEPTTGYQIAKRINTPHVNKIYTLIKQYNELFDIKKVKEGEREYKLIKGRANVLLKEIEKELNSVGESLDNAEREKLLNFLDTTFRNFVKIANQKQIWNVVDLFYNVVYGFCSMRLFYDDFIKSEEFRKQFNQLPKNVVEEFFKCIKDSLKEGFGEYVEDAVKFGEVNKDLIQKILKIAKPHPLLIGFHLASPFIFDMTTRFCEILFSIKDNKDKKS